MKAPARWSLAFLPIACLAGASESNSAPQVQQVPQASPADAKAAALLVYEEDGDTVYFYPPKTAELVRAPGSKGKSCRGELAQTAHGNMWNTADVEPLFRTEGVKKALAGSKVPYAAEFAGKMTVGDASITWAVACKKCQRQTTALKDLHDALHVLMNERRYTCQ